MKKRELPAAIYEVTTNPKDALEELEQPLESENKIAPQSVAPQQYVNDDDDDESIDSLPEGLKRGAASSGASVKYSNKEKAKTKRSIIRATEKVDSGYVKLGSDVPKYIADELSFMSKRADVSQKDYILKLILEDMFKREVFLEPKASD